MRTPEILRGESWHEPAPVDLSAFHDRAVEWAVKYFNKKPLEETMVGFFVLAGMGAATILHFQWDGVEEKDQAAYALRKFMQNDVIDAYSFITEAWIAVAKKEEAEGFDFSVPPSQRPDREDVLIITTVLRNGETKMTRFGVKTYPNVLPFLPPTKKPRLLERDDGLGTAEDMAGRMVNFFDTLEESEKRFKQKERKAKREKRRKQ